MSQQNYSDEEMIDFQFIDENDYQNGRRAFDVNVVTPVPMNPSILEMLQRHERELTLAERARTPAQRAEIAAEIAADNRRRIDMEARDRNARAAARAAHPLRLDVARRLFLDEEADVENDDVNPMR